jgi:DNA-binding NarL/FixJ family response regulator
MFQLSLGIWAVRNWAVSPEAPINEAGTATDPYSRRVAQLPGGRDKLTCLDGARPRGIMEPLSMVLASVLIVEDDDSAQRRLLRLTSEVAGPDAQVEAVSDLSAARSRLSTQSFVLALVDMQLPDGNGVELIGWMQRHVPQTQAVVVSAWAEEDAILAAIRAGAIGYLLKSSDDAELAMFLRILQRGGAAIDPVIARRILTLLPQAAATPTPEDNENLLTARESEVLGLVARGLSNREIAQVTQLSRLTIESHTRNIYRKLAVGSRTEAVFEARSIGLLA